jgi:hypothetical protein
MTILDLTNHNQSLTEEEVNESLKNSDLAKILMQGLARDLQTP